MNVKLGSRFLSLMLALVMVISVLPVSAFAAETAYAADHVVINQAYGGGGNKDAEYKNDFVELYNPTDADVSLSGWSLQYASKTGDFGNNIFEFASDAVIKAGSYYLVQMAAGERGTKDLPTPDATGSFKMSSKEFKLALVNNAEGITGKDDENVVDFLGVGGAANEFEGTAAAPTASNTTAAIRKTDGVDTDDNGADFDAKAPNPRNSGTSDISPNPSEPTPSEPVTPPSEPEVTIVTIAEALAGAADTEFTVKGVVTLVDGRNIYIQDETDAMCVYMAAAPSDIALGNTIVATGKRGSYKGLEQLSDGTYKKSEGLTLEAKETTIGALTTADVAHYIKLTGLEITAIDGTKLTLKDTNGDSIVTYKSVLGDTTYAVGDKIDFTGALGIYKKDNTSDATLQLRNTLASEIVKTSNAPVEPPVDPPVEEPTINTISEALAGAEGTPFTVKGVVTLVDSSNIYLQDATGGICVRMSSKPTDIALGDTIIGTGSKTVYNGLPQLGSGTYEKSSGLTLVAKEVANVSALSNVGICTYVKLENLEIIDIYDNDGAYECPNITVKDANGKQIQLYKAVCGKTDGVWDWEVGDKINITGALSVYQKNNTGDATLQLRNTLATEIEAYEENPTGKVTSAADFTTGTYVMVVGTGYAPGVLDGNWVTAVQPVIEGDKVTDAKGGIWTLKVNDSSVEIIDSNGVVIAPKAANTNGIVSGAYQWTWAFDETTGTFTFSGEGVKLASNTDSRYGNQFRAYKTETVEKYPNGYPCNFTLYKVGAADKPDTEAPMDGKQVVIYNNSAKGVLAGASDAQTILNAEADIPDGKAVPANGAVVFTVQKNGEYYRFYNETYGYLCSNGTGNNVYYSTEPSEDADWTLTSGKKGGYNLESRTAKFNGKYSQYLEYYSDSYKTYSMYNVTDYDIYEFFFYPVAEGTNLTAGIVNIPAVVFPTLPDAYLNTEYTFTFEVDAVFGVEGDLTVKVGEDVLTASDSSYTVPADKVPAESMTITVSGKDTKGVEVTGTATVPVKDEPVILEVSPENGFETGDDKRPVISATVSNVGENATFRMTVSGQEVEPSFAENVITYTPDHDLSDGRTTVTVTVTRADGKTAEKTWSFTVGEAQYSLYFGQLHSHTTYSDGSGSLDSALDYVKNLPESANVDFVAFTDHSNYFDSKNAANPEEALYDTSKATAESMALWNAYVGAAKSFNAENSGIIAVPGYEMTWSGGPGHMNTFNTPGIVSRNNVDLNKKTTDAGMKAYYALLSQAEGADTVNQFNHPGSTSAPSLTSLTGMLSSTAASSWWKSATAKARSALAATSPATSITPWLWIRAGT